MKKFTRFTAMFAMMAMAPMAFAQIAEIELGETYRGFSVENPSYMKWTAPSKGKLYAHQRGTTDSHLFYDEACTQTFYADSYTEDPDNVLLTLIPYTVTAGTTYYFKASLNNYDSLSSVYFSFAPQDDSNSVSIGDTFAIGYREPVYEFVPTASGTLTIATDSWSNLGDILFTNSNLTQEATLIERSEGTLGWNYLYHVVAGQTYYIAYDSINETVNVTLASLNEGSAEMTVSLAYVDPTPGGVISQDYISGILVRFNPKDVTIGNAYVSYKPAGGNNFTRETLSCEYHSIQGQWQIGLTNYVLWNAYQAAERGTMVSVVLENVSYNGVPVTQSAINNSNIEISNGNVTISYLKPAVEFTVVSSSWPSVLYSSWAPNDPDAKASVTFSENIASVFEVSLILGSHSYGSEGGGDEPDPSASVPYTINGATLNMDFSNVTIQGNYNQATVMVIGVYSTTGQQFLSDGSPALSKIITFNNTPSNPSTGVDAISTDDSEAVYYNLQGIKVDNPAKGSMLIKHQNGKSSVIKF